MLYHVIKIGDKEYKCKLNMMSLLNLEESMGMGIYEWLNRISRLDINKGQLPPMKDMITIFYESVKPEMPELTFNEAVSILDGYIEEGHMPVELFNEILEITQASGLIPKEEPKKKSAKN